MGAVYVNSSRVVPVQEDLTTEDLGLEILRGIERMQRVDFPMSTSLTLLKGEFGVVGSDGKVVRPSTTTVPSTYLCFLGTERTDVLATGKVTLVPNSNIMVKSSRYNTGGTYAVGTDLTVKDLGGGEAGVTPAATGDYVFGRVLDASGTGYLVYELFANPFKKA